jgi:hypothetical protein
MRILRKHSILVGDDHDGYHLKMGRDSRLNASRGPENKTKPELENENPSRFYVITRNSNLKKKSESENENSSKAQHIAWRR